jgi:hypothetical protein
MSLGDPTPVDDALLRFAPPSVRAAAVERPPAARSAPEETLVLPLEFPPTPIPEAPILTPIFLTLPPADPVSSPTPVRPRPVTPGPHSTAPAAKIDRVAAAPPRRDDAPGLTPGTRLTRDILWLALFLSLAIGTGYLLGHRARTAPALQRPVTAAPVTPTRRTGGPAVPSPVAAAPVRDWADSVLVPDWVVAQAAPHATPGAGVTVPAAPAEDPPAFSRSYAPLGSGQAIAQRSSEPNGADPSREGAAIGAVHNGASVSRLQLGGGDAIGGSEAAHVSRDPATLYPRVAVRISGTTLVLSDPGIGGRVGANPSTARVWAAPGNCRTQVALDGEATTGTMLPARDLDGSIPWTMTLVVPDDACRAAGGRGLTRIPPTAGDRRALALATRSGEVVTALGSAPFADADLVELMLDLHGANGVAYGVFRQASATTQISPPPPMLQLAFVALSSDGGATWHLVWGKYATSAAEGLALAGVYQLSPTASPMAFFGIRAGTNSRLTAVSAGTDGIWQALGTAALPTGR